MDGRGFVDEHEHIFDIYTKEYDFFGSNVKVISAQDLRDFYEKHHKIQTFWNSFRRKKVDIYTMAKFFVEQHSNGHFVVDECPFRGTQEGEEEQLKLSASKRCKNIKIKKYDMANIEHKITFRFLKNFFILKFRSL